MKQYEKKQQQEGRQDLGGYSIERKKKNEVKYSRKKGQE
jgi:hypothetical protein